MSVTLCSVFWNIFLVSHALFCLLCILVVLQLVMVHTIPLIVTCGMFDNSPLNARLLLHSHPCCTFPSLIWDHGIILLSVSVHTSAYGH